MGVYNNPLKNVPSVEGNGYGFFATLCEDRSNARHSIEYRITNYPSTKTSIHHSLVYKLVMQTVEAVASYV